MKNSALRVRGVAAKYGRREVLADVSFDVGGGTLLGVLGRNGSGKSTLFRCILGLFPYKGQILIGDRDIRSMNSAERARSLAYIPQSHENASAHSVLEIVLMGTVSRLSFWAAPGRREFARAERALEEAGIAHLGERRYDRLSGGEKQLVLIARALAQDAPVLVMDESCSSLDYGHQIRVLECARDLARKGYLVLLSTHNPDHAFSFVDKVLVLLDGRVRRPAPPVEALDVSTLEKMYGVPLELHTLKNSGVVCTPKLEERSMK